MTPGPGRPGTPPRPDIARGWPEARRPAARAPTAPPPARRCEPRYTACGYAPCGALCAPGRGGHFRLPHALAVLAAPHKGEPVAVAGIPVSRVKVDRVGEVLFGR